LTARSGASRRAIQRCVKTVAAGADVLRAGRAAGVVVLAYHRVGEQSRAVEIDQPASLFRTQMAEIADRVTTLDAALDALEADDRRQAGAIALTFDDGTADFVDEVVPVLYVATQFVDEQQPWPDAGRPVSWAGLRDAVATGLVTVGSHTHSHALLDRCDAATTATELDRSIDLIGEHLGTRPEHFAYPKALAGAPGAAAEVAARFRSAAVAGTRPNRFGATDPQRLARSPIQRSDGMRWFRRKVNGGMTLEDDVRRAANRLRYAGAST
jgi:peptidoglycan/xylan/chitin deacetylase (PgdA/CDA1 family)